jgi:hypothetical protein
MGGTVTMSSSGGVVSKIKKSSILKETIRKTETIKKKGYKI